MKAPCQGCGDREVGCHSKCEKYLAFHTERQAYLKDRYVSKEYAAVRTAGLDQYLHRINRSGKRGKVK